MEKKHKSIEQIRCLLNTKITNSGETVTSLHNYQWIIRVQRPDCPLRLVPPEADTRFTRDDHKWNEFTYRPVQRSRRAGVRQTNNAFLPCKSKQRAPFFPFLSSFFLINFSLSPASTLFRCNSQENFRYRFRLEHSFHWDKVSKKLFKMIKRIKRVDPPNERNYRSTRRLVKKFFSRNVSNENVIFLFESRVWKI